jgi:cobalt-zinc-cadmium efflux system membrane fusion protein
VEVQNGLFEGDYVVVQGALQLYAQSLRDGGETQPSVELDSLENAASIPHWVWGSGGLAIALVAFALGRRSSPPAITELNPYSPDPVTELAIATTSPKTIPAEADYHQS